MAPVAISRDSLDYERRGRIIGEDQYKGAIRARMRELMAMGGWTSGGPCRGGPVAGAASRIGKGHQPRDGAQSRLVDEEPRLALGPGQVRIPHARERPAKRRIAHR